MSATRQQDAGAPRNPDLRWPKRLRTSFNGVEPWLPQRHNPVGVDLARGTISQGRPAFAVQPWAGGMNPVGVLEPEKAPPGFSCDRNPARKAFPVTGTPVAVEVAASVKIGVFRDSDLRDTCHRDYVSGNKGRWRGPPPNDPRALNRLLRGDPSGRRPANLPAAATSPVAEESAPTPPLASRRDADRFDWRPGGVVAALLNHRLQAPNPPGSPLLVRTQSPSHLSRLPRLS